VFTLQVPTSSPWHGKTLELAELRMYNQHPVGFFKGVADRDAAESLVKAILWIDQDAGEQSGEEDAWYDHQLVGLSVVRDGAQVGTIARLEHLPAQDLLIVKTASGEVMVPFVKAIVPTVDIEAGVVTVTPPVGLFEDVPDDDGDPAAAESRVAAAGASEDTADAPRADAVAPDADAPDADASDADASASHTDAPPADAPRSDS
jgi:16S rRNA processing protein RimM